MNIVDRLKIYMEHTGLPISQFADAALIPRPTLSQILSGRNKKISNEVLEKLHDAFPSLNVSWLLFGDGDMLRKGFEAEVASNRSDMQSNPSQIQQQSAPEQKTIPNIPGISGHAPSPSAIASRDNSSDRVAVKADAQPEPQIALAPDTNKKIQTIMVFYTDNSFEIFTPSQR